ncbi:hypothetical protein H2198_009411 [Neophaeococcomyces mojaviensis]|uniref:Uncharacterized protein n=1 Tax=Neophaeococcomyces mojaviensis TaxID=3383035 RepID=A0ACC2ZUN4_9EURO|nr:hypothetical protein H2198_009411 [Knufia sp. JES_112]
MATEATTVNGMYDNQYSQPAELAASTPSHGASASQSSNAASTQQQKADPQEIGWYFVEQYYTTLSKSPEKIHLFYNKKSQLITGQEAEKVLPAVGTKAISEKIKSLDFSECKVRVLNVDSQASYENIVVQVIGELSNKSQPHHKFVQTFILATQPNGYFVLNDIFRYLSDDEDEIVEDEPAQEEVQSVTEAAPEVQPEQSQPSDKSEHSEQSEQPEPEPAEVEETVNTESAVELVDEKLEAAEEATAAEPETNGTDEEAAADEEVPEATESEQPLEESVTVPEAEQPEAPESTPAQTSPQTAPVSDGPPVKKTWANMVGTKAPAIPALPQTTTAAAATSAQSKPRTTQPVQSPPPAKPASEAAAESASTPTSQSNGWQTADHGKKARNQQPKTQDGIVHAYIKNVNEKIDARILRDVLEQYGKLKYYDVSRPKQCAFVEFEDPAGYAAAVASNPHTVGSEQINVEERRPRPGASSTFNPQFSRGGTNAGRGRGGVPQRAGSQGSAFSRDTPRGGFQQRGNKTGPTKGRGQAQES